MSLVDDAAIGESAARPAAVGARAWLTETLHDRWGQALAWGSAIGVLIGVPALMPLLSFALWMGPSVTAGVFGGPSNALEFEGVMIPLSIGLGVAALVVGLMSIRVVVVWRRVHWATVVLGCYLGLVIPTLVWFVVVRGF